MGEKKLEKDMLMRVEKDEGGMLIVIYKGMLKTLKHFKDILPFECHRSGKILFI